MAKKFEYDPEKVAAMAALLDVYGSETRLAIALHLQEKEMNVGEIAEALGISVSGISQHLAKMKAHGLVASRRAAQNLFYRTVPSPVTKAALGLLEGA